MQYGIYERVGVKVNSGLTLNDLRSIPSIVYHDEIWAKKECEQLDLERLGYSCSELNKHIQLYHVRKVQPLNPKVASYTSKVNINLAGTGLMKAQRLTRL